ncbi:MAG: hypothetical protein QXS21_06675 [Thermoproteota archaeon]|uniref:hypothetical protein n=1 Tax=Thermoprotei TaxID=183924 RepID=UPI00315F3B8F
MTSIKEDIFEEAERILLEASKDEIKLKLIGGLAVKYHCPTSANLLSRRSYPDIDLIGHRRQSLKIKKLFSSLGYSPRVRFNAIYGDRRLIFNDLHHSRRVDIFLDIFEMCHTLDLSKAVDAPGKVLGVTYLLMTKLQIIEATEKDLLDSICLLKDHSVASKEDEETISTETISELTANDWGLYKTFTISIEKIRKVAPKYLTEPEVTTINRKLDMLLSAIEAKPKSLKWKTRSLIGEKVPWYQLPEPDVKIG